MFNSSTLAILGVGIFLATCLIVSAVGFLMWKHKSRSVATVVLATMLVLMFMGAITVMTMTLVQAYASYQLEGACIKQKIAAGVPRKNIHVADGKCMIIRGNDG
mgnify:CR=1 FL=1